MFQQYKPATPLRTLERNLLVLPTVRPKHGDTAFCCYASQLWSVLPDDIKDAPTAASFKYRLKTQLFSDSFC